MKNNLKEIETCAECDGPCIMNTEYEGSAICKDKNCTIHNIDDSDCEVISEE